MTARNVFSLEEQMRLAREGIGNRRRSRPARLSHRYADALEKLARAERELARALNKWDKLRRTVRRLERELDKLPAELEA